MSDEEEACIKYMINYPIRDYPDLVTPARLQQCGFGPDLGNSAILLHLSFFSS